jgi:rare lipoprotein A
MQKAGICFVLWFFWGLLSVYAQAQLAEQGKASYYASKFEGRLTANGEKFTNTALTAAHPSLAFNTLVKVTNTTNGKSVVVRINDRGPHTKARILDMSAAAAREIDMIRAGIATVQIEVLGDTQPIARKSYAIASIPPRTLPGTAPAPGKRINIPFSCGHNIQPVGY